MKHIKVNDNGTLILINVEYITSITKISSNTCYIEYLAYDSEKGARFKVERAQANIPFV